MDIPIGFRAMNLATAKQSPAGVQTINNETAWFYARYLMKRAISAVNLKIPDEWDKDYVAYTLFGRGFGVVVNVPRYGVIFQGCTLYGRNVYYQPTRALTANPLYTPPAQGWVIGKNCEIVKLQPDYSGMLDIVWTYAARLALAYEAWQMNSQNSKLAYVIGADGKSQAATFEKLFDKIQSGVPAVAVGQNLYSKDGKPMWQAFTTDLKQNYIAPEISADMRSIMSEFDSFVGIPSNPNSTKKERQIVDEVNANNIETDTIIDLCVNTLNDGFDRVNAMFGLSCRAEKKYPLEQKQEPETAPEKGGEK